MYQSLIPSDHFGKSCKGGGVDVDEISHGLNGRFF